MYLDNEKITLLFKKYRAGDTTVYKTLMEEISLFVYHFPRLAYKSDEDSCGEFYLYLQERLSSIIEEWNENLSSSFFQWFIAILRYRYLDFCRWRKRPEPHLPLEEDTLFPPFDDENAQWEILRKNLELLPSHDKLWIKWFYLPEELSPEDITLTRTLTGKSYLELLDIQKNIITAKLKDIDTLREITQKLSSLFEEISALKILMQKPENKSPANLQKLLKLETSRERLRQKLLYTNRDLIHAFGKLFRSPREGKYRLYLAETKLKNLIHHIKGETYVLS